MNTTSMIDVDVTRTQASLAQQTRVTSNLTHANPDRITKMAKDFESMVVAQLLGPMFDMMPTDGAFGGGSAEATMRSFYVDEVAKSISQRGGLGISDAVQCQMIMLQGGQI